MEEARGKRKGLRVPVSVEARCKISGKAPFRGRIINLSTEGIFLKTAKPVEASSRLNVEFLLPGTMSSVTVAGEVVWQKPYEEQEERFHVTGVKFLTLKEPYRGLIREYTLTRLYDDNLVRSGGILRVLEDIRNLPSMARLKAYHILIKKETKPLKR
jgi:uncharacterized protein (TIGR02266 family)